MSRSRPLAADRPGRAALLGGAVSAACLAGVVVWAMHQGAPRLPSSGRELVFLVLAIGLYALSTSVRAERWHRLMRREGATIARRDTYGLTVVGYAGNNVLPARAGDVLRVLLAAPRGGGSKRSLAGTLLAERVLDVAGRLVVFAVVAGGLLHRADLPSIDPALLAASGAVLGAAGVAALAFARRHHGAARVVEYLRPAGVPTLALRGRHGARMLALTVVVWVVEAAVWGCSSAAAGLDMNALDALYLVSLASLASMIPSGPGYAGTQAAPALVGFRAVGAPGTLAVGCLLVVRFVLVVPITLLGFVLLAVRYGGLDRLRGAVPA